MYRERTMLVVEVLREDDRIQLLKTNGGARRAILYKQITKKAETGDIVLVNTTATDLSLGTGGWDIVQTVIDDRQQWDSGQVDGHIMKARYTPVQHSVLAVESQESGYHQHFQKETSLQQKPIWLAELHSMVPLFYFLTQQLVAGSKCCVIFDDQACLPLQMSEQLRVLQKQPNFSSVTVGQAFGGTYEAVTIASALQFASDVLQADFILISVGPGVVGTGTRYGFTGMEQANWSHTVSALEGVPVWIPRMSFAEKRRRHQGLSHHTLTPFSRFTFAPALLPIPYLEGEQKVLVQQQLNECSPFLTQHQLRFAKEDQATSLVEQVLSTVQRPIKSMGRTYEDDPIFFKAVGEAVLTGWTVSTTS